MKHLPRKILLTTNNHLGDSVALTAALHDAKKAFPDFQFDYDGKYGDVFRGNPDITRFSRREPYDEIRVTYAGSQRTGDGGNLCEAASKSLSMQLGALTGIFYQKRHSTPYLHLTKDEKTHDFHIGKPYCVLNTNSQNRSEVKAYPHYQRMIDILNEKGITPVLIGGDRGRDITEELHGCVDLRLKTTQRELFSLVYQCELVISPSSGVIHIGAAFRKRMLCIIGARESPVITRYPNCTMLTSKCRRGFDECHACMRFYLHGDHKACEDVVEMNGKPYARCMCEVSPEIWDLL